MINMGFTFTNKKGQMYYLHRKDKLYYFSKEPSNEELPEGYIVVENVKTGLPIIKKGQ